MQTLSGERTGVINRTWIAALLALAVSGQAALAAQFFVSPNGNDKAIGGQGAPFKTIQRALEDAGPGDTVVLAPGRYKQDIKSVRDGRGGGPITITGPASAIVQGSGERDRVVEINHDHHVLKGFVIDGKVGSGKKGFRDKLIYVIGRSPGRGVTGFKAIGMTVRNAGGECIRLRYLTNRAEIAGSRIGPCGAFDYQFKDGGKNGEGIYVGTGPEQLGKRGAPDRRVDASNNNRIHSNVFNTNGNECVDIKEGSSGNIVENNSCTGQRDKESAGLNARGERNVFRNNKVFGNVGAGIRFGGDKTGQGVDNQAYGNTLTDNKAGGFALQSGPQGKICDNRISGGGPATFGRFKNYVDPTGPCSAFAWRERKDDKDDKGDNNDDDDDDDDD